jgi:hypothetical protein
MKETAISNIPFDSLMAEVVLGTLKAGWHAHFSEPEFDGVEERVVRNIRLVFPDLTEKYFPGQ